MAERARRLVGRVELATRRVIAVGAAGIALVVVAAGLLLVLRQGDRDLPLWFVLLAASVSAVLIGTGVVAPWLGPRALRTATATAASGYLLQVVLFLPAHATSPHLERAPWMLSASTAAVAAALLAFGPSGAWIVLVVSSSAAIVHRVLVGGLDLDGVVNDVQTTLAGAVVCVVGAHLLAAARELDTAAAAAAAVAARAAAEKGRLSARARAGAVVHDEVLATLALAGSDLPVPAERLADQATRARVMVVALADEGGDELPLVASLRAAARQAGAAFVDERTATAAVSVDATVALAAAVRQALDNSVRHARASRLSVALSGDARRVRIDVVDDGVGFDPDAVPADRLGMRASILAGVRAIPGGLADVETAPGAGTRVRLEWAPRTQAAETIRMARELAPAIPRAELTAIAIVFVIGQLVCAVGAAQVASSWWAPALVLCGVLAAAGIVRFSTSAVPSRPWAAVFVAVVVAGVAAGLGMVPFSFGTVWFVASGAFLLVALALRGRPLFSIGGIVTLSVVVVAAGIGAGAPAATIGSVLARPVVLVGISVALLLSVEHMQRRTRELQRCAADEARAAAWDAARRAELRTRAGALDAVVLPMLGRIARGGALSARERGACIALEGELRDEYRAGRLVRAPLTSAVRDARARGVDVVLLDDAAESPLDDAVADAIAVWIAEAIATARSRAVGRVLPPGRDELARVTVDGETTAFGG